MFPAVASSPHRFVVSTFLISCPAPDSLVFSYHSVVEFYSYNSMTAIISTRGYFKDNLFFLYIIYFGRYMYLYIHVYLCDLYHSLSFCQSLCLSFYLSLWMQLRLCV